MIFKNFLDMDNKVFRYSLIISFLTHAGVIGRFSYSNLHYARRPVKKIEVTYQVGSRPSKAETPSPQKLKSIQETKLNKQADTLLQRSSQQPPLVQELSKLSDKFKLHNKQSVPFEDAHGQRKVSLPEIKSEKINNPVYLNYYQIVRIRIRERAYQNYSRYDSGQVYLTFVLSADGTLRDMKLIEEKTFANPYLREVGFRSVQEASPFPPFPVDLHYPELSFNVIISFEVKE
jgi:hypothetical protein